MNHHEAWPHLPGQSCLVTGPTPLLLNTPDTLWVVQAGSVALFTTAVCDGAPVGARRALGSVGPGAVLVGAAPMLAQPRSSLLAIALEATTQLVQLAPASKALQEVPEATAVAIVDSGVYTMDTLRGRLATPEIHVQASSTKQYRLSPEETLQPQSDTVTWVQLKQGTVRWLGLESLTLTAASGLVPLGPSMWLSAVTPVQLETVSTAAIPDLETRLRGLEQVQHLLLRSVDFFAAQETQEEFQRFLERQQRNHQMRDAAVAELAAILQPHRLHHPHPDGSPLLVAARAVGAALGVPIHPSRSANNPQRLRDPLEAIARASRLRMRQVVCTEAWWRHDHGPLLAYTHEGHHPVALLPVSPHRYHLFDPRDGSRTPVRARLAATLAPVAYTFYRPLPLAVRSALALLRFGMRGHGRDLLMVLLTGTLATLLGMLTPLATAVIIDQAVPDADRGMLLQVGGALLAAACGQGLCQLAQGFVLLRQEVGVRAATQAAMWDRLLHLPPAFFRQYATGDVQARVMAVTTMSQKLSGATLRTLFTSVLALLNLGLMLYYHVRLSLVAMGVALVASLVTLSAGVLTVRSLQPLQVLGGTIFGLMVQLINGVTKLRVAGAEERAFAYWGTYFQQQQGLRRRLQAIQDHMMVVNTVLPTLASVLLFWWATRLLAPTEAGTSPSLTTGTFLAFYTAFGTFMYGATGLSNTIIDILDIATLWERAKPILEAPLEVDAGKADPGRLAGKVALEHVTFRYHAHGPVILDDISISAEPGEFLALVGPSGGGKSTIFRLLLGFEMPEAGTIYYDDQDLSRLDVYAVRRQLGVVLQQSSIMAATMFDNISSGAVITMDEAWEAARAAGLVEDITAMPMGMHTYISEGGGNLSGGQRQRVLIARALVCKPRLILFDEATSALDNRTQAMVTASLDRLRVTRMVIAHRLSTIRHATRIYVLAGGRIVQQGRFEELAHQEGLFAQLMARQLLEAGEQV